MNRALLIGQAPASLPFQYVQEGPFQAVVIGSLSLGQLLRFQLEPVLTALAEGKQVYLYTPGLPPIPKNRGLAASMNHAQRELKSWGVIFTDGHQKRLITAEEATAMRRQGLSPASDAMLTPLAKEILEG